MKRIYFHLLAVAAVVAAALGIPASAAEPEVVVPNPDNWVCFAATGNSGSKFVKMTNQKPAGADYSYSMWNYSATEKNLWLSTPAMDLAAGTTYTLDLQYQTWSDFKVENFEIYLADAAVESDAGAEALSARTPVYRTAEALTGNANAWFPLSVADIVPATGQKILVFHVWGECQGRFSVADVKMTVCSPVLPAPLAPTGLTAAAADDEVAVNLAWTLPAEDTAGQPLEGDNAVTAVAVYRNGEKIATVEGAATTFTDSEATGLVSGGPYTYAVAAVTASGEGELSAEAVVDWVGMWSFSQTALSVSNDNPGPDTAWTYSRNNTSFIIRSNSANPGNGFTNCVQTWNNASLDDIDAWISSPRLDVPAGKTVRISFYFRFNPNVDTEVGSVKAYLSGARAAAGEAEAETAKSGRLIFEESAPKGTVTSNTPWEHVVVKGIVSEETPLYLNFNVTGTVCKGIYISGLTIEQYAERPFMPAAPSGLTATAAGNQKLEVALSWTNPAADTEGVPFGADQTVESVYIYRDDFETPAVTLEGDHTSFTDNADSGLTPGAHTYRVKVAVAGAVSAFSNEAAVSHVGPATLQTLPWEPTVTGLSNDEFKTMWISWSESSAAPQWTNRPAGIFLMNSTYRTAGTWLVSAPLDVEPGRTYHIEYTITSTAEAPAVEIGFVDTTTPDSFYTGTAATVGTPSECKLTLEKVSLTRSAAPEFRLALRDAVADPEDSYNVVLKALKVSKAVETGITGTVAADTGTPVAVYDLSGRRVAADTAGLPAGIYIMRFADGTSRKCAIR